MIHKYLSYLKFFVSILLFVFAIYRYQSGNYVMMSLDILFGLVYLVLAYFYYKQYKISKNE
jgi:heme A synthase